MNKRLKKTETRTKNKELSSYKDQWKHQGYWNPTTYFRALWEDWNVDQKSDNKYKKVQYWTKRQSELSPFKREDRKLLKWLGKFMARAGIKGYHVLLTGAKNILADYAVDCT